MFRKGLPFQSKKNWKGRDRRLASQARDMMRRVGNGIVINYTPDGYSACEIEQAIEARGNRRAVANAGHFEPLGQMLANRFLECRIGILGLYYDNESERFLRERWKGDIDVVDTRIAVGEPQGPPRTERR